MHEEEQMALAVMMKAQMQQYIDFILPTSIYAAKYAVIAKRLRDLKEKESK